MLILVWKYTEYHLLYYLGVIDSSVCFGDVPSGKIGWWISDIINEFFFEIVMRIGGIGFFKK
jgi:hypothetical protein